jgi:8-oxo-dGTP pyrophosphatase MutT (NUDIX family)
MTQAAGCIIVARDTGRWCLQQRSLTVNDPGVWSTWGGGCEPQESLTQTVRRELREEAGYSGPMLLKIIARTAQYATFLGMVPHEFEPQINHEVQDWCWCEPDQLPEPLHNKLAVLLGRLTENFADGKKPGRRGLSKRVGIPRKATLAQLEKIAQSSTGERRRMAQWQLNMRRGRRNKQQ